MDYNKLEKDEFDAIITGELTHYAIWLEDELSHIISDYFVGRKGRQAKGLMRLLLRRDGLTFQDKIEIVRGMLPLFEREVEIFDLKDLLKRIEKFKSRRNAMAHGFDVSNKESGLMLKIEVVSRSGKEIIVEITPDSHNQKMEKAEKLLKEVQAARKYLWNTFRRK